MKSIQPPKAIIFDWDDTLVDSWHVFHGALNTMFEAMGRPLWTEEETRQRIGPPARVLFTELFGEENWQKADNLYIDAYLKGIANSLRVHEHVEELLRDLSKSGIYLAVVSNKRSPVLKEEAAHSGFAAYFSRIVGAGDAVQDKPDIAAVLLALEGSDVKPGKDVWFVGDGNTDMIAARNAGLTSILIETKLPSEESLAKNPPEHRFKTHRELKDFLLLHAQSSLTLKNPRNTAPEP